MVYVATQRHRQIKTALVEGVRFTDVDIFIGSGQEGQQGTSTIKRNWLNNWILITSAVTNYYVFFFLSSFPPVVFVLPLLSSRRHRYSPCHCQPEGPSKASVPALHLVHEDHIVHGAHRDDARDPQGAGLKQLRVRGARALHAAVPLWQPGT